MCQRLAGPAQDAPEILTPRNSFTFDPESGHNFEIEAGHRFSHRPSVCAKKKKIGFLHGSFLCFFFGLQKSTITQSAISGHTGLAWCLKTREVSIRSIVPERDRNSLYRHGEEINRFLCFRCFFHAGK